MKSYILLENVTFFANHGVFPQENKVGNIFVVNMKIELDLSRSCLSDELDDTVSYADIYAEVREEMMISSKLIEHVAYRIIRRIKNKFPSVVTVELKLSKKNPPIEGEIEYASVLLID